MPLPRILEFARDLPITVQRVSGPADERHRGRLIGHIHTVYLVIAGFRDAGFERGESLLIRMLVDNEAVAYQTTLKHVVESPRMYFISFPEQVESVNLRRHERIRVFFPADVRVTTDEAVRVLNVMIVNISAGGCAFTATNPVPAGAPVALSFALPGARLTYTLRGTVLETRQRKAAHVHRVAFDDSPDNATACAHIAQWVADTSRYALE